VERGRDRGEVGLGDNGGVGWGTDEVRISNVIHTGPEGWAGWHEGHEGMDHGADGWNKGGGWLQ
jgi:hypothetical protein